MTFDPAALADLLAFAVAECFFAVFAAGGRLFAAASSGILARGFRRRLDDIDLFSVGRLLGDDLAGRFVGAQPLEGGLTNIAVRRSSRRTRSPRPVWA